jgi:hypothetical protein
MDELDEVGRKHRIRPDNEGCVVLEQWLDREGTICQDSRLTVVLEDGEGSIHLTWGPNCHGNLCEVTSTIRMRTVDFDEIADRDGHQQVLEPLGRAVHVMLRRALVRWQWAELRDGIAIRRLRPDLF